MKILVAPIVLTLGLWTTIALGPLDHVPNRTMTLTELGQYSSGIFDRGGAEIVAHDPRMQRLFVVNAGDSVVDVLDIYDPSNPIKLGSINASDLGAAANSVAVSRGVVAVAIEAPNKQNNGLVAFYDAKDLSLLNTVEVGALPDMLTFTPDGKKVLVANEGEPSDDYMIDPEGSISVIDLSEGVMAATVATADFRSYNSQQEKLLATGVRIYGPNATVAQDLEPEYITLSKDGRLAWVTLQENNAMAVINVSRAKVMDIRPLGYKDHHLSGNELDASDRDGVINIRNWPVLGMYLPDAIDNYHYRNRTYLVTANEGDTRDYPGFTEEERIGGIELDPTVFPNADDLQANGNLGRLKVTSTLGDTNGDGFYEGLYSFGSRSFSIWDSAGRLIYDSGADFELITAKLLPQDFNSDNAENNSFDSRSDDKGPEPEGLAIGQILGRTYAFIGLERIGGIMVYDITNPHKPSFMTYANNRNLSVETCFDSDGDGGCDTTNPEVGDLGPEGLIFIPSHQSPIHKPLLVVGNEVSGTTTIFQIDVGFDKKL